MKVIEPKKSEIFKSMKANGCCWLGGHGCMCHYKSNWNSCFEDEKKFLTRTEYTAEEIAEQIKENEKAMEEIYWMFDNYWI